MPNTSLNRKLLTSVYNAQETREAMLGGCRIVDCEDPRSALGNIKPREIMDIADAALDFKRDLEVQISTNIGEDQLLFDRADDGRAIEKSPYEIAGKAAQAAIGVAVSMGTKLHPVNLVKVGVDGMTIEALSEVLKEVVLTLDRTEGYSRTQVMSVLFAQDVATWKKRRSNDDVIRQLVEVREFQPAETGSPGSVDLTKYVAESRDRAGNRYFGDKEEITLKKLIEKGLLPPGVSTPAIRVNDPFPHSTFFPGLSKGDERTNQAVIKGMVDATVDSNAKSIMLDTSILSKVARIPLVDTDEEGSEIVDLNEFDVAGNGLVSQGILPYNDLKFFVDYCHFRGVAMNLAGSIQSFQAQQLWVLIPEIDQISGRGSASALPVDPTGAAEGKDNRHSRVIKRAMVRGLAPPEQGGVLNIPEAWLVGPSAEKAQAKVQQAAEMIRAKRKAFGWPDLECFTVNKYGVQTPYNP
jgi:uncharacterized protein (UPF0264 family)